MNAQQLAAKLSAKASGSAIDRIASGAAVGRECQADEGQLELSKAALEADVLPFLAEIKLECRGIRLGITVVMWPCVGGLPVESARRQTAIVGTMW